jgi:hypothetical protein
VNEIHSPEEGEQFQTDGSGKATWKIFMECFGTSEFRQVRGLDKSRVAKSEVDSILTVDRRRVRGNGLRGSGIRRSKVCGWKA